MKTLYTAHATAMGGRAGHVETSDGALKLDLAVPAAMGGGGTRGGTNPEELFASGYAACFGGALEFLARQQKIETGEVRINAAVGIGPDGSGAFGLAVTLDVTVPALDQADAEALVHAADQVCPYSNGIRGNVEVTLNAHGGA